MHDNRDGSLSTLRDCAREGTVAMTTGHDFVGAVGTCSFTAVGDVLGGDPLLDRLSTSGALLPVRRPQAGSPLIDHGDPNGSCAAFDARRVARPQDGDGDALAICDIGAVERLPTEDGLFSHGFE